MAEIKTLEERIRSKAREELSKSIDQMAKALGNQVLSARYAAPRSSRFVYTSSVRSDSTTGKLYSNQLQQADVKDLFDEVIELVNRGLHTKAEEDAVSEFVAKVETLQSQLDELRSDFDNAN